MLLVYLFALTLLYARLACLFPTTFLLDFFFVFTFANLHFYLFNAFILYFLIRCRFFLLPPASLAWLPVFFLGNSLALVRLIVADNANFGGRRYAAERDAYWLR